jgi:hypothetical protein
MRQYATEADLTAEYPDTVHPANVARLLKVASAVVDTALAGVVYDVDASDLPTDADVTEAMMVATCAIVAEWVALAAAEAGASQQWESVAIGNVSLSTLQGASATDSLRIDGFPVPPLAITMLRQVGNVRVVQP